MMEPWAIGLSLAVATLVSEDLACISAGVLAAQGTISVVTATLACFMGILAGDLLLFLTGRVFGRRLLEWPIAARRISPAAIDRSSEWIRRRGVLVVLASRFAPGTRLPTCLAAGMLRTDARLFTIWFALAAAIWTPLIVGLSATLGSEIVTSGVEEGRTVVLQAVIALVAIGSLLYLPRAVSSWATRRRWYAKWRRLIRWEYWPMWAFYPPILIRILGLMIKFRGPTVFTAVNPAIPGGGFVGESKFDILRALAGTSEHLARAALLQASYGFEQQLRSARQFMEHNGLGFPVVLKPDQGQRGSGVTIVKTAAELARAIHGSRRDLIIQEYVSGPEFGVFYVRHPAETHGRIFSLTEKRFPEVIGDGRSTLEQLILADARTVCMERLHCRVHERALQRIPVAGERVPLVEIGSHCRGSLFLDARHLLTPELEAAFDAIAQSFNGFHFGRFDVRASSIDAFQRGEGFKILELNGVTSEATHIYDPANSLIAAYRVLFAQWRLAFEIGAANVARGAVPATVSSLLTMVREAASGSGTRSECPPIREELRA